MNHCCTSQNELGYGDHEYNIEQKKSDAKEYKLYDSFYKKFKNSKAKRWYLSQDGYLWVEGEWWLERTWECSIAWVGHGYPSILTCGNSNELFFHCVEIIFVDFYVEIKKE